MRQFAVGATFSRYEVIWGAMTIRVRRFYVLPGIVLIAIATAILFASIARRSIHAGSVDVEAVARQYPNFTIEQRMAILRFERSQQYPLWRDLSIEEKIKRLAALLSPSGNSGTSAANFVGNLTEVSVASNDLMELEQQSDCSLTLQYASYNLNLSGPTFSYTVAGSTPHYEQVLHNAAGLTTTPDKYPVGCGNTASGNAMRKIVFAGTTTGNIRVYAAHFYDSITSQEEVFTENAKTDNTFLSTDILSTPDGAGDIVTADLNGDGNGDLVVLNNYSFVAGGSATVTVFLGKADGSFSAPTAITMPGTNVVSVVIDDFNGDGKKDIVVSSEFNSGAAGGVGFKYYINFLAGNGDGTFQSVKTYTETPPASFNQSSGAMPYFALISADLRGSGHKDIVSSAGIVLFGNGDGTFTQSSTLAFPNSISASQYGPNVVAADFNKDGKPDLAVDNGASIQILLGKGDGTFTFKETYSATNNAGYIVAQDIDGDGNIDLYSGTGNNGTLGGDQFGYNQGYALMGNGDGTFRGAPSEPFMYSGTNLGDLNGDKITDVVGVNLAGTPGVLTGNSFTSYLGDGKGSFTLGATLDASSLTIGGTTYMVSILDSYSVGDINGDGFADLIFIGDSSNGTAYNGIFVATGKGDGSFNTPTFVPTSAAITDIRLADMNHDGKLDLVYFYNLYTNSSYTSGVAIQFGNGDGTFHATPQLTPFYTSATGPSYTGAFQVAQIANVNSDGNNDMIVLSGLSGNAQSFTTQVYLGKGDGTFQAPIAVAGVTPGGFEYPTQYAPITLADMNNDGKQDIVALQMDPSTQNLQIAIALGNGDGTFRTPVTTTYSSQYVNGTGLAVADFNGDGKLDVATTGFLGAPESGIAFGNGDGTLQTGGDSSLSTITPAQSFYVGVGGPTVALDLNGDGKPDIVSGSVVLLSQAATSGGGGTTLASTTTISSSASSATVGQNLTFTATVAAPAGNSTIPTGTVTFLDGTTSLGTGTLNSSGVATFATSTLAAGTHSITAQYAGDSNFTSSVSSPVTVTIAAVAPSFTLSASPSSLSIAPGNSGTTTISVTAVGGFAQSVSFACSGLPSASTCSFAPETVTPGASAVTTVLTITTTAPQAAQRKDTYRAGITGILALASILLFLMPGASRAARWGRGSLLVIALAVSAGLIGCGGGSAGNSSGNSGAPSTPGTPAGTSNVTVTATSGSISQAATLQLVVR